MLTCEKDELVGRVSHVIKYILFHTACMSLHPQYAIDRISVMHFQLIAASDMNNIIAFIDSLRENFKIFSKYFFVIFKRKILSVYQ